MNIRSLFSSLVVLVCTSACGSPAIKQTLADESVASNSRIPATQFDLSHWKITLPEDKDFDGKADSVDVEQLQNYYHPDYFFLDSDGNMVFTSPNKSATTSGSSNSRSELRQMLRGTNTRINTSAPLNNFALAAHPRAHKFGSIGGRMEATLKVTHVAEKTTRPNIMSAYAVVIGQIHAKKDSNLIGEGNGFGWGNEPLKIFYKKRPEHSTGSLFWTYELNLEKNNAKRKDIDHMVWGNNWKNDEDPGKAGIALGEEFSYVVNVYQNIMQLTFTAAGKETVTYTINLADNRDPYGQPNLNDNPHGYAGDSHYFKAGVYNQCNTGKAGCSGTGDWATDKANGDYASATFSRLVISEAQPISAP